MISNLIYAEKYKSIKEEIKFDVDINYRIEDENKNILDKGKLKFNSFVNNFANMLYYLLTARASSIKATSGIEYSLTDGDYAMAVNEGSATTAATNYGIIFGDFSGLTDSTYLATANSSIGSSVSPNDFTLQRKFNHSGLLLSSTNVSLVSPTKLSIQRTFINDLVTNDTVYVSEIGLVGRYQPSAPKYVLLARDRTLVNSAPLTVAYGKSLIIEYVISLNQDNSYTTNMLNILYSLMSGNSVNMVDTTGATVSYNWSSGVKSGILMATTEDTFGIQLGGKLTGQEFLITPASYVVPNKILSTSITHNNVSNVAVSVSSSAITFGASRLFENPSGSVGYRVGGIGLTVKDYNTTSYRTFLIGGGRLTTSSSDYLMVNPLDLFKITFLFSFALNKNIIPERIE